MKHLTMLSAAPLIGPIFVKILQSNHSKLNIFGKFLSQAYLKEPDTIRLACLLSEIEKDWQENLEFAHENRILTNFIAIIIESPGLSKTLKPAIQEEVKARYMRTWRRSELIKRQLRDLSIALQKSNASHVVLIKGGCRLFDNLYSSVCHRYMSDLDLFFKDPEILKVLCNIDYQSDDPDEFDLANVSQQYLERHKKQNHHLPPVKSLGHPCYLEMHQHFVNLRAVSFCRSNIFELSVPMPELPGVRSPVLVDQLILNLLHMKYGDRFTFGANFRMRNVLEGYLLYQKLTANERFEFYRHFYSIGRSKDVKFWKLLCFRLFETKEFDAKLSYDLRLQYFYQIHFGQNSIVNAIIYSFYFIYRLISKELWTSSGRKILRKKIASNEVRQKFLDRIRGGS